MNEIGLVLVGIAIAVGLVGIVVALLPGLLLIWAAVGVWAFFEQTPLAWSIFAFATVLTIGAQVLKFLIPGRRLEAAGVPRRTLFIGAVLALVGFFVVPVVGLPLGFVAGVYLAERWRHPGHGPAWTATWTAIKAVGLSILIEMGAGLFIAGLWLASVILFPGGPT
ncbi:MAG TPA: DUF456 domain-containing protein [Acidimicrobiia bacterium]|nr:DUF456 domain-containing protein [Acidimicrobiia bacterium]